MSAKLTQTMRGTSSSSPVTDRTPSMTTVNVRETRELTQREQDMALSLATEPDHTRSVWFYCQQ